jgi:flagellar motility protein MotE (MotC chaperone)
VVKKMADEKEEVLDAKAARKAEKKAEKQRKKEEKKLAKQQELEDDTEESSGGSKVALVFVTLIIIIIWLAILALLVKMDVGGFGSTVLAPVLKDVPYINKILPATDESELGTEDTEYPYQTLDEAVAYIKELELELQTAQEGSSENSAYVAQLESEVAKLQQYEQNEADFENEKAQFYEEVVFNDKAPDISEYQKYYESIDPANAEELYKEVVQQEQTSQELTDYVSTYSQMKPKEAAAIFDTMTDNLELVAKILNQMDRQSAANILGKMDSQTAAKVSELMEPAE